MEVNREFPATIHPAKGARLDGGGEERCQNPSSIGRPQASLQTAFPSSAGPFLRRRR